MIEIIIPYYNGSKTIDRALASIASQTDTYKITTIVDDCSTEDPSLLNNIVSKYDNLNIRILRTDINSGAGIARQIGIDNARAPYLMFLDCDDVLMPYTIRYLNYHLLRDNPDMLSCAFKQEIETDFIDMSEYNGTWLHGKVFKKKFLEENDIRFIDGLKYNEDSSFITQCLLKTDNIIYKNVSIYVWINNKESTVRGQFKDYYIEKLSDYVKGQARAIEYLIISNDEKIKNKSIAHSIEIIVILYMMYVDINREELQEKYKIEIGNFIKEVQNYFYIINYNELRLNKDFMNDLSIEYWKNSFKLKYGPIIPTITFKDFLNLMR